MEIKNIRMADGTPVPSVQAAVEKFKCPGPCNQDCPLYRAVRIKDENFGHLCHPEIASRYPFTVLDAMGCSYQSSVGEPAPARYAAVIRSAAVRDAQYCKNTDHDPMDDDAWTDMADAEIWLGIFTGPGALAQAAEYGCTVEDNVRLIPLD